MSTCGFIWMFFSAQKQQEKTFENPVLKKKQMDNHYLTK